MTLFIAVLFFEYSYQSVNYQSDQCQKQICHHRGNDHETQRHHQFAPLSAIIHDSIYIDEFHRYNACQEYPQFPFYVPAAYYYILHMLFDCGRSRVVEIIYLIFVREGKDTFLFDGLMSQKRKGTGIICLLYDVLRLFSCNDRLNECIKHD